MVVLRLYGRAKHLELLFLGREARPHVAAVFRRLAHLLRQVPQALFDRPDLTRRSRRGASGAAAAGRRGRRAGDDVLSAQRALGPLALDLDPLEALLQGGELGLDGVDLRVEVRGLPRNQRASHGTLLERLEALVQVSLESPQQLVNSCLDISHPPPQLLLQPRAPFRRRCRWGPSRGLAAGQLPDRQRHRLSFDVPRWEGSRKRRRKRRRHGKWGSLLLTGPSLPSGLCQICKSKAQ
mmetsp:Transcript_82862/g.215889  ORF Transcript_82862/g.215889 Transcript_82862/m.215889 type:complete len:238 (+) Transcript_82862:179-892(+)